MNETVAALICSGVPPVGDGGQPGRFDEAEAVGRGRDADVVTPAEQLATNGDAGLDVAPASVACQHNFH